MIDHPKFQIKLKGMVYQTNDPKKWSYLTHTHACSMLLVYTHVYIHTHTYTQTYTCTSIHTLISSS